MNNNRLTACDIKLDKPGNNTIDLCSDQTTPAFRFIWRKLPSWMFFFSSEIMQQQFIFIYIDRCSLLFPTLTTNMYDVISTFVVRYMFNFPKYIWKKTCNARCFFQKISRSRLPLKNISSIFPRKINRTGQTIPYEMMNRITIYNPGYVSK